MTLAHDIDLAHRIDAQTFMVCVDGGLLGTDDAELTEVQAMDRARRLKAEHPEYLVTIVVGDNHA